MAPRSKAMTSLTRGPSSDSAQEVNETKPVDDVKGRLLRVFEDANGVFTEGVAYVEREIETSPATVIGGAVAVGFMVGGGLFTTLTGRLFSWTVKAAAVAALVSVVRGSIDAEPST